ncbi:hypothetical protein CITRIK5_10136 [Citricoccus sp. K5]|nr:hypothetical protein CITRIK5_10136 [Citricoccus sp. K5]
MFKGHVLGEARLTGGAVWPSH